MNFFTKYNPPSSVGVDCSLSSVLDREDIPAKGASQQFAAQCDVNEIIRRTNGDPWAIMMDPSFQTNQQNAKFGDFTTNFVDYHAAQNYVKSVTAAFNAQPSGVRALYNQDAGLWAEAMQIKDALKGVDLSSYSNSPKPAPTAGSTPPTQS